MALLDKAGLFAEMTLKTEVVKLQSGDVTVTEMPADDYMEAYDSPLAKGDNGELSNVRLSALICVRSMVDENGKRILADEDAEVFRKGASSVFRKINAVVNRLNGLSDDAIKN